MRIISWNVNSVRSRLPRLLALLHRHKPDVVCLQETKVPDRSFPTMQMEAAGYRTILYGQLSHNGVAILLHDPTIGGGLDVFGSNFHTANKIQKRNTTLTPTDVKKSFPNDPVPNEARVLSACIGGLRIVNVYVVNGVAEDSDQFEIKEHWMAALGKWLQSLPTDPPLLVVGDFNVAPDDRDVWDPVGLRDRIHCTAAEREWLQNLQGKRLKDLLRVVNEQGGLYTWWPYRQNAFEQGWGLRFDLALGDETIVRRIKQVWVDQDERRPSTNGTTPSDHAPVIVDLG